MNYKFFGCKRKQLSVDWIPAYEGMTKKAGNDRVKRGCAMFTALEIGYLEFEIGYSRRGYS